MNEQGWWDQLIEFPQLGKMDFNFSPLTVDMDILTLAFCPGLLTREAKERLMEALKAKERARRFADLLRRVNDPSPECRHWHVVTERDCTYQGLDQEVCTPRPELMCPKMLDGDADDWERTSVFMLQADDCEDAA